MYSLENISTAEDKYFLAGVNFANFAPCIILHFVWFFISYNFCTLQILHLAGDGLRGDDFKWRGRVNPVQSGRDGSCCSNTRRFLGKYSPYCFCCYYDFFETLGFFKITYIFCSKTKHQASLICQTSCSGACSSSTNRACISSSGQKDPILQRLQRPCLSPGA